MKFLLFSFLFIWGAISLAKPSVEKGLPFEADTSEVRLAKIPFGKELNLEFDLELPTSQGLNKGAPSFVAVYEKDKGNTWKETSKVNLNEYFAISNQIHFSKKFALKSDTSQVAIFSTIYHCGRDHKTPCYIQGFKGIASRSTKAAAIHVPFYIQGSMR